MTKKGLKAAAAEPVEVLEAAIAERAYGLWEAEGRPPNAEVRHWLQAEEEVRK